MIRLACPSCAKKLAVEDSTAGSVCKCPACANKFRVPQTEAAAPAPTASGRSSAAKKSSASDSASRGSGSRREKAAVEAASNGQLLDELELVDEDDTPAPRRKTKKSRSKQAPQWIFITAAAAGAVLCALLIVAFFSKAIAIGLIVVGLPASLMGRKWQLIGAVGVAYLLTGAGFFVLHSTLWKPMEGPPPEGATAQEVDSHCETLLKRGKTDASGWVGVEKRSDSSLIKGLRAVIRDAYDSGAKDVWLANLHKVDATGLPSPDLIVVLPPDDTTREHVLNWYQRISAGKRTSVPGERYIYVAWD
jgi:hypothetical protein